jgi:nitrogen fixation protein NifX
LQQLQKVLSGNPPPWLRKALNKGRDREIDFEDEVIYG